MLLRRLSFVFIFRCLIPKMCVWSGEYQIINPTTQIALFSRCSGDCSSLQDIGWNLYEGMRNVSTNVTLWTQTSLIHQHAGLWFFGERSPFRLFLDEKHMGTRQSRIQHESSDYRRDILWNVLIREVLALRSCVQVSERHECKFIEFHAEQSSAKRFLLDRSIEWHHNDRIHCPLFQLAEHKFDQRLLLVRYEAFLFAHRAERDRELSRLEKFSERGNIDRILICIPIRCSTASFDDQWL